MIFYKNLSAQETFERLQQELTTAGLYFGHGTDNARDEAGWLLDAVLRRDGIHEYETSYCLTEVQLQAVNEILQRRVREKKPLAYLLQEAWFAGLSFYVDERVLVPRSPLAELINTEFQHLLSIKPERILDLCCGSACIGIACASVFPEARVDVSDVSADALEVAGINISKHGLESRVNAIQADLFKGINASYDLIISNPPYVGESEYQNLPEEYLREPKLGLVSGQDGLNIPSRILREAADYLTADGVLVLEVGHSWEALANAFPDLPFLWLDFEYGGEGVCVLKKPQLQQIFHTPSRVDKYIR